MYPILGTETPSFLAQYVLPYVSSMATTIGFQNLLLGILCTPLLSAVLICLFCRKLGKTAAALSIVSVSLQMVFTLLLSINNWAVVTGTENTSLESIVVHWLKLGDFTLDMGIAVSPQAVLMLLVVTVVGFCIHIFSLGYMRDDDYRGRFFGGMSIFMFSMTGIVLSDNLFMMFIFWELVGFSSYMLIGHYLTRPSAAAAAKKAFIVNRIGDFGFLLGIILCYYLFGTTNFELMLQKVDVVAKTDFNLIQIAGLLLFCGVLGKSAQMPLHVWLPDAMEGPTPVSALMHAATMVAAGVYLLGKIAFMYVVATYEQHMGASGKMEAVMTGVPYAVNVIAAVGIVTAVYAGFCALGVRDIKKILAYSTLSQLGYMVAAFGVGCMLTTQFFDPRAMGMFIPVSKQLMYGTSLSMFHLTTHAAFKALLFLGAGSVIFACHHEQDIFKMGGLWRKMPITTLTFLIGLLALCGIPPLAGFHSKDMILASMYVGNPIGFGFLTMGSFLTAFYMWRLFWFAFLGKPKSESAEHAHENGLLMLLPLVALAVLSAIGGYLWLYPTYTHNLLSDHMLPDFVVSTILNLPPEVNSILAKIGFPKGITHMQFIMVISVGCALCGLFGSWVIYKRSQTHDKIQEKAPKLYKFFEDKLYFDEIYNYYVSKIQDRFASLLSFLDMFLIGGLMVRGVAGIAAACSLSLRLLHVGKITVYVYWFFFGLLIYWLLASGIMK